MQNLNQKIPKMNNRILLIETATDACSAAVAEGTEILSVRRCGVPRSQAGGLAPLISGVLEESGTSVEKLSAVAVSSGPGSYTGLRVGVSTAKGICFGAGIPLIGIETTEILAHGVLDRAGADSVIIPMIDARRMEVYTALFDSSGRRLSETRALILEPDTFAAQAGTHSRLIFTGDGAEKYMSVIDSRLLPSCTFIPRSPDAADMASAAADALNKKRFEDTAYFEPFYLKEFIAASPSRKIEAVLHPEIRTSQKS